ncbi:hypothetical protein JRO89_XS03G0128300 [Xanthoceras sorbifolium]|uniref:Protein TIC 22-like, chloroplastic n=1 Tax=Xanthoceras sorbifolium TaxID=99658 RepID=A0ABQ8IAP4_9ROSI|nr:hypothetical protein JRO89_XS03G0128300 [Xanthoceras sorbifolium]
MNSSDSNPPKIFSLPKQAPQFNLHQALSNLQTHFNGFLRHTIPSQLHSSISSFQDRAKHVLDDGISRLTSCSLPSNGNQVWARIGETFTTQLDLARQQGGAALPMSTQAIEERLGGIPVYALSNANEEFVLVSGVSTGKSLGLLCFKEEDAATLLEQMKTMNPLMRQGGSKVVTVALKKVVHLKIDGVAFRLIPEATQVKNALEARANSRSPIFTREQLHEWRIYMEREKAGFHDDGFSGVPVFQEDLEKSLARASRQQNKINPALRRGDIQVAVFEEIIKGMKEGTTSTWNDVVFVPPGFDVSADPTQQESTEN